MNLPTITPERAKELRALADQIDPSSSTASRITQYRAQKESVAALRDYARLIDTVLDGGDVVTPEAVDLYLAAQRKYVLDRDRRMVEGDPQAACKAGLTAALPAIRLRLLKEMAK